MEYRILIPIQVTGSHIHSDRVSIGAVGTQNAIALDITFDETWRGLTPMIFWFDSTNHDIQVAETVLTTEDQVEDLHYIACIPSQVFNQKGVAAFVIEGSATIDDNDVMFPTEYGYLTVRGSSNDVEDIPPEDDPLSILQQVQNLENLANEHATRAETEADRASDSATEVDAAVIRIYAEVDAAEGFADAARTYALQSRGYSQTAQSYVVDSQGFADDARTSATSAVQAAAQAEASAEAAEGHSVSASTYANTAAAYTSQAQTYRSAAEISAALAKTSETAAQSAADRAEASAEEAAQEFTELQVELEAHIDNTVIHVTAEEKARWDAGGGGGGGTDNYNALNNKPSINGVTLLGNKTLTDLGFTTADCEKIANKVTTIDGATATDTNYPSEKAVSEALTALSTSLSSSFGSQISGLSQSVNQSLSYKENSSNKSTSISGTGTATNYPTTKAVVDYISMQNFESTGNRSSAIDSSTSKYPTNNAVKTYVDTKLGDIETVLNAIIEG